MTWRDSKSAGDIIDADEFTNLADTLEWVSGSYIGHSSNVEIHSPSSNLKDWFDSVYSVTGAQGGISSWYDLSAGTGITSFGGSVSVSGTQAESITIDQGEILTTVSSQAKAAYDFSSNSDIFDSESYIVSANAIERFTDSSQVNWTKITAISSGFDGRLDTLEAQDTFDSTSYVTSTNAITRFADSSNIQTKFLHSGVIYNALSSQSMSSNKIYSNDLYITSWNKDTDRTYSLRDWYRLIQSPGLISGGAIHSGANDGSTITINISGGTGLLREADNDYSLLYFIKWEPSSNIKITKGQLRYAGVKYNSGNPVAYVTDDYSTFDFDTNFPIGIIANRSGAACIAESPWKVNDVFTNIIERFDSEGWVRRDVPKGGLIIGETGTRNITLTEGKLWTRLNEHDIDAIDTSAGGTPDNTNSFVIFVTTAGGYTVQNQNATQWPNTQYDDGAGSLVTLDNNTGAVLWWYLLTNGTLCMLYGREQHTSIASAENEAPPSSLPVCIEENAILVGRLIFAKNGSTAIEVQSAFVTQFTAAQAADHGQLAGLSDDDHTQYYNQTRINTISSNALSAILHSANSDIHLTASQKTDLTDGNDSTAHKHDTMYYTETELNNGQLDSRYYTEGEVDTISGAIIAHSDNTYEPLLDQSEYYPSSLGNQKFTSLFSTSSSHDNRLDALESYSSNAESDLTALYAWSTTAYNNEEIDLISGSVVTHTLHNYYNSSLGASLSAFSSNIADGTYECFRLSAQILSIQDRIDTYSKSSQISFDGYTTQFDFDGVPLMRMNYYDGVHFNYLGNGFMDFKISGDTGLLFNVDVSEHHIDVDGTVNADTVSSQRISGNIIKSNVIYVDDISLIDNTITNRLDTDTKITVDYNGIELTVDDWLGLYLYSGGGGSAECIVNYNTSDDGKFLVKGGTDNELLCVDFYDDMVGISTISPQYLLHVDGSIYGDVISSQKISGGTITTSDLNLVNGIDSNYVSSQIYQSPAATTHLLYNSGGRIGGDGNLRWSNSLGTLYANQKSNNVYVARFQGVDSNYNIKLRIGGDDSNNWGYFYLYSGQGTGDANYLSLHSDNLEGDDFIHVRYHQENHDIDYFSNLIFQDSKGVAGANHVSSSTVSGSKFKGLTPMTYNIANVQVSANHNINLARFITPSNTKAYLYQCAACNSGGVSVSGLCIEMLSGSTSVYKTSSAILQQGNPLASTEGKIEIRFMYSGGAALSDYQYGSAFAQVGVW